MSRIGKKAVAIPAGVTLTLDGQTVTVKGPKGQLAWTIVDEIELKYFDGEPVIAEISRVSKPGRRVYSSIKDLKPIKNGLGISILSTPKGVMSDTAARDANVGGEVLCRVY